MIHAGIQQWQVLIYGKKSGGNNDIGLYKIRHIKLIGEDDQKKIVSG